MLIFGHRGAAGHAPENSLLSIRQALELGVDGIEFDVRATRDGIPVLLHDETLDRTTPAQGVLAELTLTELSRTLPEQSDRVPVLADALHVIGGQARVNVELKDSRACEPTCDALRGAVAEGSVDPADIIISCFDHEVVAAATRFAPEFPVALLIEGPPEESLWTRASELAVVAINIDLGSVTAEFVSQVHAEHRKVMVYTVNEREQAERMRELRVDAIFSDFPDRVSPDGDAA